MTNYFLLLVTVLNLLLAILFSAGLKGKRRLTSIHAFIAFTLASACWAFGVFLFINIPFNLVYLKIIDASLYIFAAIICCSFMHLSLTWSKRIEKLNGFQFLLCYLPVILTVIATTQSLIVLSIVSVYGLRSIVIGPWFYAYTVFIMGYFMTGMLFLIHAYFKTTDVRLVRHLRIVILSSGLTGIVDVTFNLLLIPFYNYKFLAIGPLSGFFWCSILSFAIIKYDLLDVRLLVTKGMAKIVTLLLLLLSFVFVFYIAQFFNQSPLVYLVFAIIWGLGFQSCVSFIQTPLEKKFLKGYYNIQQIISDLSTDLIVARDVKTVLKTISVKLSSEVETDQSYFIFREMPDSRMALFKESENEPFHEFKDEGAIIEYFHEHNEPIAFGKIPVAVKKSISQLPISEKSLWFPIKSINQLHGIFILGKKLTGDKYTETDYHMVKAVMNQLLVVFDRNHMYQQLVKEKDRNQSYIKQLEVVKKDKEQLDKDLERASKVQKRTLPQRPLTVSNYIVETQFVPSDKVSGDYYTYFKFNEDEYGFLIADAVGHGVTAALNSMIFKSILEKNLDGSRSPKEVLELLNQTIYINPSFTQYMPVIYGKLNTKTNTFTYANAGHHAGLAYIDNQFKALESGGPPLGMSDDETFEEERLQLNDNDLILLYSDGLEDGRNEKGEEFGRTGVEKVVRRYREFSQEEPFSTLMLDTWSKYKMVEGKQKDDMAYIFIEHIQEEYFGSSS